MNCFTVLFVCVQTFLIQNAFSQCLGKYGSGAALAPGYGPPGFAPGAMGLGYPGAIADYGYPGLGGAYPSAYFGYAGCGLESYGGAGEGNVAVAGELPVAGTTAVAGQVPILGAVSFGGTLPAAGVVTISGNCACGCGSPYLF